MTGKITRNELGLELINELNEIGILSNLQTSDKSNLVAAINEVKQTSNTKEKDLQQDRQIAHLMAIADIDGRALGKSGSFYDLFDGTNDLSSGLIDTTKSSSTTALSVGDTSIPVSDATGFSVGQEITVFDDVNLERPIITAINGNTLTVTALTKAYKTNATVCRSSVIVDTVNKVMKFGGWSNSVTYDHSTPVSVVNSAYDTSGNGGRKLVRLSNGWLVAGALNGTTDVRWYASNDNGSTWSLLAFYSLANVSSLAITSNGTKIYALMTVSSASANYFVTFDATTVSNTSSLQTTANPDIGQTSFGSCSLACDSNGKLWATWASKNSTYPNSYNIRVSSSTDGTTWATPTQVTVVNTSGYNETNPVVVIRQDGNPVVIIQENATNCIIYSKVFNGTTWSSSNVIYSVSGTTYTQSNPSAVVDSSGVIHVVWHGLDSTDTTQYNLRYSKSTDGGVTWSTMQKLTSGNATSNYYPSITVDKNNKIWIVFIGRGVNTSYNGIREISSTDGVSWDTIKDLTTNTTAAQVHPSTLANYTDFTDPLVIYQDNQAGAVKFRGVWSDSSVTPVLVEDVRYNLTPPTGSTDEVASWLDHSTETGFTVDGALSIVASGANESYSAMTKTTSAIDATTNEDELIGSVVTAGSKVTMRLTLTRANTTDDVKVTKLLGAIA